jgi:hypothetical protein
MKKEINQLQQLCESVVEIAGESIVSAFKTSTSATATIIQFTATSVPTDYEEPTRLKREYSIRDLIEKEVPFRELQQLNIARNLTFSPNALIPGNDSFQVSLAFFVEYSAARDQHALIIKQMPIVPSTAISTGRDLQMMWLASSPVKRDAWQNLQRGVAHKLGFSPAQLYADFAMLVPGSHHIDSDGYRYVYEPVCFEIFLPQLRYSIEEMEKAFGSVTANEEAQGL